eukprot:s2526_g35.t1
MEDETIARDELLPSRFVLVNKSDPRNPHPSDEALEGAVLKARLVIAGQRDQRAGDFETESPTASLLAHNLLCFSAPQWNWRMAFSDISAAFLLVGNLPAERRVFMFVKNFLRTKLPSGARTDVFRMKKAGFGFAESPRLWYHRFKCGAESVGGREPHLCPRLFSFFGPDAQLQALLAVHVDDVKAIADPNHAEGIREKLISLFSFGEWKHPYDWTKFCGRYEKQPEDGTVLVQVDFYADRLIDPPWRASTQYRHPLQPNQKKWIGTIAGQLDWMAMQCRVDLAFGVSRAQQFAGANDPAALSELRVLVDRARQPATINYEYLGCDIKDFLVLAVSHASFGGMPRGRSQGGFAVAFANPEILQGHAKMAIVARHSGLLKRVVRPSLAAEISQGGSAVEEADFVRALLAEATRPDFSLFNWLPAAASWKLIPAPAEDGGSRLIRWVPGEELLADDLTKLVGNRKLMLAMSSAMWALKDTDAAKNLGADAVARKRTYRQRATTGRAAAESARTR